jgi:hypothetical protein
LANLKNLRYKKMKINILLQDSNEYKTTFPQSRVYSKFKQLKEEQTNLIFLFKNSKITEKNYNSIVTELQDVNLELMKINLKHKLLFIFQNYKISFTNSSNISRFKWINQFNLIMVNPHLGRLALNTQIQGLQPRLQNSKVTNKGVKV